MKGRGIGAVSFIVLIVMNGYILSKYVQSSKYTNLLEQEDERQKEAIASLRSSLNIGIINSNYMLDSIVIRDSLGNYKFLTEIFEQGQKQVLVFRYSEAHCESCIQSVIKVIRQYSSQIGTSNLVFIGNYQNNRIYSKTLSHYMIKDIQAYNSADFNTPAEDLGSPYLFVIDINGRISNVFLPDKGYPDITALYLESIIKKFSATEGVE